MENIILIYHQSASCVHKSWPEIIVVRITVSFVVMSVDFCNEFVWNFTCLTRNLLSSVKDFPKISIQIFICLKKYIKWTHIDIITDNFYKNDKPVDCAQEWDVKIVINNSIFINPFIIVIQIYRNNFSWHLLMDMSLLPLNSRATIFS